MTEEWHPVSVRQICCKMHNIMMEVRHTRSDVNSTCGTVEMATDQFLHRVKSKINTMAIRMCTKLVGIVDVVVTP